MLTGRKHRTFDLQARLAKEHGSEKPRIKFDRLPRRKVKPMWWSFIIFVLIIIVYFYLRGF